MSEVSRISGGAKRPGRFRVLFILLAGTVALLVAIVGMSTREPSREYRGIEGADQSREVFGGVRQLSDRLGKDDAPVQIQVFTDVQSSAYAAWFLEVIPTLANGPVRGGDIKLLLRGRSFTTNATELSFYGVLAAGEQDYSWNYAYLVARNLGLAKDVGLDEDFLQSVAEAIEHLEIPVWRDDFEAGLEPGSEVTATLEEQDKLAIDLKLRAEPALVITGPAGTKILQDAPSLTDIEAAIGEVG